MLSISEFIGDFHFSIRRDSQKQINVERIQSIRALGTKAGSRTAGSNHKTWRPPLVDAKFDADNERKINFRYCALSGGFRDDRMHVKRSSNGLTIASALGHASIIAVLYALVRILYMDDEASPLAIIQARSEATCPLASRNFATRPAWRALIGNSFKARLTVSAGLTRTSPRAI